VWSGFGGFAHCEICLCPRPSRFATKAAPVRLAKSRLPKATPEAYALMRSKYESEKL
jgi:hypothetical protein